MAGPRAGEKTIRLNYIAWEDLRFPAQGINPPGAASDPAVDTTDACLNFAKAATNIIAGVAQMPHSWADGTYIVPHIHWAPVATGGGNVLWRFGYSIADRNGVFPAETTIDRTAAAGTVAAKHLLTSFGTVDMAGKGVSTIIKWTLSRIGGDAADTLDNVAKLLELDFHYQIDSHGSGQELTK
jgi:hypothetical protein